MNSRFRHAIALTSSLLVAAASGASADVTLTVKDASGEHQIRFTKTHIRIEDEESMIFDAEAQVIRVLQPSKMQYMEITRADIEMMGEQMAGAQSQMAAAMKQAEGALAQLPPEQRAMIEEKMKAASGPPAAAEGAGKKIRFEKVEGSETIVGAKCQKYRVYAGDTLRAEAWIAAPKDLGVDREDLQVFHGFTEFMASLPGKMGREVDTFSAMDPESANFVGIPARVVQMEEGSAGDTFEITAVDGGKLGSEVFATPEGWKRVGPLDGLR